MADDLKTPDEKRHIARSAKLPSTTPSGTRKVVTALSEIAGAVSRERLATHLKLQLTGGVARALGSAGLYGFVTTDADKRLVITDRGLAFVGDDAGLAKQAEREALMSTGFGPVIRKLSTRRANVDVVALRLQEDQGVHEAAARDRANLLVRAANEAGLVAHGNFDGGLIEDTIAVVGNVAVPAAERSGRSPERVAPAVPAKDQERTSPTMPRPEAHPNGVQESRHTEAPISERPGQGSSANIPSATPESTKRIVRTLAELAGPATRARVASRLNVRLGGRFASSIVAALQYGFVAEIQAEKLIVTERGRALIGADEAASRQAQCQAIMSTAFGATIRLLSTHRADQEIVAVRLQDDLGLPGRSGAERAKVLVKGATDSGLIVNGRFNAEAIEDTVELLSGLDSKSPADTEPNGAPREQAAVANGHAASEPNPVIRNRAVEKGGGKREPNIPFDRAATAAPIQIVLQIDASRLNAQEIAEIVRELKAAAISTAVS